MYSLDETLCAHRIKSGRVVRPCLTTLAHEAMHYADSTHRIALICLLRLYSHISKRAGVEFRYHVVDGGPRQHCLVQPRVVDKPSLRVVHAEVVHVVHDWNSGHSGVKEECGVVVGVIDNNGRQVVASGQAATPFTHLWPTHRDEGIDRVELWVALSHFAFPLVLSLSTEVGEEGGDLLPDKTPIIVCHAGSLKNRATSPISQMFSKISHHAFHTMHASPIDVLRCRQDGIVRCHRLYERSARQPIIIALHNLLFSHLCGSFRTLFILQII